MNLIGIFLSGAILWFLITLFTDSLDSEESFTETSIVVIGMIGAGIITHLILVMVGVPFGGIIKTGVQALVVYFLVLKICGTDRKTSVKVVVWFFGISFVMNLVISLLISM
jgi:hypothetical protein